MTPDQILNLQRCAVARAHIAAHDRNRGRYWRELATWSMWRFHIFPDRQWLADCEMLGEKL